MENTAVAPRSRGIMAISQGKTLDVCVDVPVNGAHSPTSSSSVGKVGIESKDQPKNGHRFWQIPLLSRARRIYARTTGSPLPGADGSEDRRSWTKTVVRFGPLSGIFALLLALLSIVASLGVLAGSNHTPVTAWTTSPSTYIAIFTAVANLSMRYAAVQGVIITWWVKALQGSNVGRLHYDWRAGASDAPSPSEFLTSHSTSIRGAVTAGRRMGWLGLACICSTLVVIDGPLLQRASSVIEALYEEPVTLYRSMVPQLPQGYTGAWSTNDPQDLESIMFNSTMPSANGQVSNRVIVSVPPNAFQKAITSWQEDKGYAGIIRGCSGVCTAKLVGPTLAATNCVTRSTPANYTSPWPWEDEPNFVSAPPFQSLVFATAAELVVTGPQEEIDVYVGHATTEKCIGTYSYTTCTLKAAVGEFNVTVRGNTTTLDSAAEPKILEIVDNAVVESTFDSGDHRSSLAGVVSNANLEWESYVAVMKINGTIGTWEIGSISSNDFRIENGSPCSSYADSMSAFLASMNKLMVYYGVAATEGERWGSFEPAKTDSEYDTHTTVTGYVKGQRSVFHTEYGFFIGATAVELLCMCLVAPTYWGWWKIGRSVSFSPLEIAKAFEAPALADANSNSTGRDMADTYGDIPIQYGASSAVKNSGRSRLAFVEPSVGHVPEQGSYYDA